MMRPEKMHWVLDVVIGQAKAMQRAQSVGTPLENGMLTEMQWNEARESVKTYAARLLSACQKEHHVAYKDYVKYYEEYKGKQRG